MKIIQLKEGDFLVSKTKVFNLLAGSENASGIKMAVQPFLVVTATDHLLLDAGVGWKEHGKVKLMTNLQAAGVQPAMITKVLLSHLHKDHINGLVISEPEGFRLAFPQSKVYIQQREYDYALTKSDSPSYDFGKLNFLVNNADIVWLNADEGHITPEISYLVTGGHTPFHQVFWLQSADQTFFYGADNLPQSNYLDVHIAYKTDDDGKKAMQWRIKWEEQAKAEHWTVLLYHDLYNAMMEF